MLRKYILSLKYALYGISLAILLFSFSGCMGKDNSTEPVQGAEKTATYGVILKDNSVVRIDPIIYSSRVTLLKKGERVEILDQSKTKGWIGNTSNYWYKIRQGKGIIGWVFGNNLKIFSGRQVDNINNYLSNLREEEERELKKILTGRWWSVDKYGEYTNHSLEIFDNGTYKSMAKGGKEILGEYNFNFNDKEIIFLNKTSFNYNLKYIMRGNIFYLEAATDKLEMRFKKIHEGSPEPLTENNEKKPAGEPQSSDE